MQELKGNELIRKCMAHDRAAQKALYDRYSPMAYGICMRFFPINLKQPIAYKKAFSKYIDISIKSNRKKDSTDG